MTIKANDALYVKITRRDWHMRVGCGKVADTLSASLVIHFITG
jgi:hypothetical protein